MSYISKLINIGSELDMQNFAIMLANVAQQGDVFLLDGELGVGKSFFSRQFINHLAQIQLGQQFQVPSPTFTLVQMYDQLSPPIWHFDLYRLSCADEAYELGLEDALKQGICLIEWPSRLDGDIPQNALTILFKHKDQHSRTVEMMMTESWAKRLETTP
ncbi:MAG: tRNA (adenosine(37)-N6)-threonylcarbamoyltransferase complex ATPase subunit type 1 TsaE [Rhizobiales bacterium]|nr:tRNA (adenosine(37)-N6)-threonylcarbamoyltransferase complex ATPase subunit type 1 TsaE [Hyphomicrobiales bacterium]NRB14441.1 tRNA (adenosine(37)-N6)-threonylcarbamoyltransferase complex ATPase subunit type 1 TsaE [Hyphomicrobiales bacterium]